MKTKSLHIRMNEDLKNKFEMVCKAEKKGLSEKVTEMIVVEVAKFERKRDKCIEL